MKKYILMVDDSDDTRELFRATLEADGFSVLETRSGIEALELLRRQSNVMLILLDLSMPEMTGLEFLEEMQKESLGQNIPVMLVSAADNLGALNLPSNVIDTLKKPFFYPELIYKIRERHGFKPDTEKTQRPYEARP